MSNPTPRKCKGHWKIWLRNSKLKKNMKKEENLEVNVENGKCLICGGVVN